MEVEIYKLRIPSSYLLTPRFGLTQNFRKTIAGNLIEGWYKIMQELETLLEEYTNLNKQLEEAFMKKDFKMYTELSKKISIIEPILNKVQEYNKIKEQLKELDLLLSQGEDEELLRLAEEERKELIRKENLIKEEILAALKKDKKKDKEEEDDDKDINFLIEIRAGTGGEEASLFVGDLFRMYIKFISKNNWKYEVISSTSTGVGGFKEIIFSVSGKDAYERLRSEGGVHRVQRIPQTESSGRIHTSAATVAVLKEPKEKEIIINPSFLKIETFRASGPGGQHVNVTDSAVRITHLPTGITVACQDERSQHKNKEKALRILKARLKKIEEEKERNKLSQERREMIKSGDRSEKIRTYNYTQNRITDHRFNISLYNLKEILDGKLDELLDKIEEINNSK